MSDGSKVQIIEDDKYISEFIAVSLRKSNYQVLSAADAAEGMFLFSSHHPQLVLLDLGLPDRDGVELIRDIREAADTPIIVVSARGQEEEKIAALDAGAADYVTKPFYMGELLARIRVVERTLSRLSANGESAVYQRDWLTVDLEKRRVWVEEQEVHLTPHEYKLLVALLRYRGRVLTYNQLIRELWGVGGGEPENVRVFMSNLRRKVEKNVSSPRFILTEVGVGYRWNDD